MSEDSESVLPGRNKQEMARAKSRSGSLLKRLAGRVFGKLTVKFVVAYYATCLAYLTLAYWALRTIYDPLIVRADTNFSEAVDPLAKLNAFEHLLGLTHDYFEWLLLLAASFLILWVVPYIVVILRLLRKRAHHPMEPVSPSRPFSSPEVEQPKK